MGSVICVCFFFQAEDGIRDLVRSRGLGDVYKRQPEMRRLPKGTFLMGSPESEEDRSPTDEKQHEVETVSYTHLTLPTSDLV